MFERFFFVQWLGVPLSLRGRTACPAEQIHRALADKGKFPSSFELPNVDVESTLCRAVGFRFDDPPNNMQLVLRAPNLGSCNPYVEKWDGFKSAPSMKEAIRPHNVMDESYDRYGIAEQARSIWTYEPWEDTQKIERTPISVVVRFRLTNVSGSDGFCVFEFRYEAPARR